MRSLAGLKMTGLLALAACQATEPTRATRNVELRDDLGTAVVWVNSDRSPIAWLDASLYVVSYETDNTGSFPSLSLVPIGGVAQKIDVLSAEGRYVTLAVSPDKSLLYYVTAGPKPALGSLYVRPTAGGEPELISARIALRIVSLYGSTDVTPSPDSREIAYVNDRDSLFVYTAATHSSRFVKVGCMQIGPISTDGREIICMQPSAPSAPSTLPLISRVSLSDGTSTLLTFPNVLSNSSFVRFRWTSPGPSVLYRDWGSVFIANLATQTTRLVVRDSESSAGTAVGDVVSWSPDGNTLAYWRWESFQDTGIPERDVQYLLHTLDLTTLVRKRVAVTKYRNDRLSPPVFSPTGDSLAFQIGGTVYLKKLR